MEMHSGELYKWWLCYKMDLVSVHLWLDAVSGRSSDSACYVGTVLHTAFGGEQ